MIRFVLAALLSGAAHLRPWLWPLGFVGFAALGYAHAASVKRRDLVAGAVLFAFVSFWTAHPWSWQTIRLYCSDTWASFLVFELATVGAVALLTALPLAALGPWLATRVPSARSAWLPLTWLGGEWLNDRLSGVSFNDWLYAQWTFAPVLRLVALVGWTAAAFVCLAGSAAVGEALARRDWRKAWPAVVTAVLLAMSPALESGDLSELAGVGAVHAPAREQYRKEIPEGVDVLVWPESASVHHPRLAEGVIDEPHRVLVPVTGPALHLLGVSTRHKGVDQNSVVWVDAEQNARQVRAKSRLFPLVERDVLGVFLGGERLRAGDAPPVIAERFGTLICFEALSRPLALAAKAHGARVLTVHSNDRALVGDAVAHEQFVGVAVLRAVETGLPVVRASLRGVAVIVGKDGSVLARSEPGSAGVLTIGR